MKRVKRANRVLKINDELLESYLRDGYSEIDEKGNVINEVEKNDVKSLKKDNKALRAENDALRTENESLNAKIEALQPTQE